MTTPNWDITSTCTVRGEPGLLLVEAKAHAVALDLRGKRLNRAASLNSQENHKQIGWAIAEASDGLASTTGKPWGCPGTTTTSYQTGSHGCGSWHH